MHHLVAYRSHFYAMQRIPPRSSYRQCAPLQTRTHHHAPAIARTAPDFGPLMHPSGRGCTVSTSVWDVLLCTRYPPSIISEIRKLGDQYPVFVRVNDHGRGLLPSVFTPTMMPFPAKTTPVSPMSSVVGLVSGPALSVGQPRMEISRVAHRAPHI